MEEIDAPQEDNFDDGSFEDLGDLGNSQELVESIKNIPQKQPEVNTSGLMRKSTVRNVMDGLDSSYKDTPLQIPRSTNSKPKKELTVADSPHSLKSRGSFLSKDDRFVSQITGKMSLGQLDRLKRETAKQHQDHILTTQSNATLPNLRKKVKTAKAKPYDPVSSLPRIPDPLKKEILVMQRMLNEIRDF
jgi:hypothetical protein